MALLDQLLLGALWPSGAENISPNLRSFPWMRRRRYGAEAGPVGAITPEWDLLPGELPEQQGMIGLIPHYASPGLRGGDPELYGGKPLNQQAALGGMLPDPEMNYAPVEDRSFPAGRYAQEGPTPGQSINPLALALLSAGAAGLQQSGWQNRKVGLGEGLGTGLQAGLGTYLQATQMKERSEIAREQLESMKEYRKAQTAIAEERNAQRVRVGRLMQEYPTATPERKAEILQQLVMESKPEALLPQEQSDRAAQFHTLATGKTIDGKPEMQDYSIIGRNPDGSPMMKPEGKPYVKGAGVEVQVPINVKTAQEFWDKFAETQASGLTERGKVAREARLSMMSNAEALKVLKQGAITGFGADFRLGFGKMLQLAGVSFVEDPVANTDAFVASMAGNVGRLIKQFGAGTGLSDADREFATKMAGGQITLTQKAIERIVDINNRASAGVIKDYNREVDEMMKHPGAAGIPFSPRVPTDDLPGFQQDPWDRKR